MTTTEAAARLNLSKRRILDFIREGRLKAERHGRDWWISPADVEAFAKLGRPAHRTKKDPDKSRAEWLAEQRDATRETLPSLPPLPPLLPREDSRDKNNTGGEAK